MRTRAALFVSIVAISAGCGDGLRSPSAPTAVGSMPASPEPGLVVFRDRRTGFSTSDLRDAGGQVVRFNSQGELIWTADGTRLHGYWAGGNQIPAEASCRCSLVVRYGIERGERHAYLTADYGHDNPGTLVDLDVVGGVLQVGRTKLFAPGTYTQSGVITELTERGPVPVEGVVVYRLNVEGGGWQEAVTDAQGFYALHGLYDGGKNGGVHKDGYVSVETLVVISGDTRFDAGIVRK